ncbi:hypothetical protein LNP74_27965 [Klebsiella pneumoniae subsp. pneumoniae]|nr:hypothetical protein [Klebsiella pneumoniae subsp. pneumoniae]
MIEFVLQASPHAQLCCFILFNGLLSSISDNVVSAQSASTSESGARTCSAISRRFPSSRIALRTIAPAQLRLIVATPNNQAAFLFHC